MQCSSYCTGQSYDLAATSKHFSDLGFVHKIYGKDVLHVEVENSAAHNKSDAFIFNYGCVVFWGLNPIAEEQFLNQIIPHLSGHATESISDRYNYIIMNHGENHIDEESNTIILNNDDSNVKLSFSYGLSQSVKLGLFEASVEKTIDENKKIPSELIETGKISMSRKALAKKIGTLFAERNFINLNSDILDTPDFFWKRPRYEPYYNMAVEFMDIAQRLTILNSRLKIIHELYGILSTELHHSHSSRLEWIIIFLILIEVLLAITKDLSYLI